MGTSKNQVEDAVQSDADKMPKSEGAIPGGGGFYGQDEEQQDETEDSSDQAVDDLTQVISEPESPPAGQ